MQRKQGTAPDAQTLLLIHSNTTNGSTTFTDSTGRHTITPGTAVHTTTTAKFGTSSINTSASDASLTINNNQSDFIFGLNDFTIDFWLNVASNDGSTYVYLFHHGDNSTAAKRWDIRLQPSGVLAVLSAEYGHTWNFDLTGTTNFIGAGWKHVAVVRGSDDLIKLYVNGVLEGTQSTAALNIDAIGWNPIIGTEAGASCVYYLDEYRVSNVARWTTNFTPPTAPY